MPLYSVSKYVQGLLNGTPRPSGVPGPLVAWITPPTIEKIKGPRAYVWGGRARAARQTAPRGPGFQQYAWTIDIYVVYMDTPGDAMKNEPFPQIIDTIVNVFQTTTMPLFISATGAPVGPNATSATDTQILSAGESFDIEYPPERLPASLRMTWYASRISMEVKEAIQR